MQTFKETNLAIQSKKTSGEVYAEKRFGTRCRFSLLYF